MFYCVFVQMFQLEEVKADDDGAGDDVAAGGAASKVRLMAGALVLCPEVVGRVAEVRLWASHRTEDQLQDFMDTHLDLADTRRKKLAVQIKDKDWESKPKAPAAASGPGFGAGAGSALLAPPPGVGGGKAAALGGGPGAGCLPLPERAV